jgi:hypothetical protein
MADNDVSYDLLTDLIIGIQLTSAGMHVHAGFNKIHHLVKRRCLKTLLTGVMLNWRLTTSRCAMFKSRYQILLFVCLSMVTLEVWSMGLFDFLKVCLFSEVNGVVTLEGKPVAGAELVRTAMINDKEYTDKTVTDEGGKFHFDAMYTHSINKIVFIIEPVIPQTMTIFHNDKEYLGWRTSKRDYHMNAELDGEREIDLKCELTNERSVKYQTLGSNISGICDLEGAINKRE